MAVRSPRYQRRRLKAFNQLQEVNSWANSVDDGIASIILSLGGVTREVNRLTNGTGQGASVAITAHATKHLPNGTDPLATGIAGSIFPDDVAAIGTGNSFSRSDHKHAITADVAGSIAVGDTASEGVATSFARSDHRHAVTGAAAGTIQPDDSAAEGVATTFARSDHRHAISADTTAALAASAAEGVATSFSRADHVHVFPTTLQTAANTTTLALIGTSATVQTLTSNATNLDITGMTNIRPATTGTITIGTGARRFLGMNLGSGGLNMTGSLVAGGTSNTMGATIITDLEVTGTFIIDTGYGTDFIPASTTYSLGVLGVPWAGVDVTTYYRCQDQSDASVAHKITFNTTSTTPSANTTLTFDTFSGDRVVTLKGDLTSSTYTPTLTNVTNVAASTAYQAQYIRVGDMVTVSGKVDIDPTAAGATALGVSLPIASNFAATEDCAGAANASGVAESAAVRADTTNDRAEIAYITTDITNQPFYYTFTYQII